MERLDTYRAKRDFRKTSEPSGKQATRSRDARRFVMHKHDATRLHYDLRLEHDGVLMSWAVTRGPSLDPANKRLAVHVEDHPLDYGSFEGNIPKGEYGAGAVIVWDEGQWIPEGDPDAGLKKGHLRFELKAAKLNGTWDLVRLKPRPKEKRDNWLLIKADDAHARPGEDILADAPESVVSGRTVEEVAAGEKARASRKPASKARTKASRKTTRSAASRSARKRNGDDDLPVFVEPALATLRADAPVAADWLHEVKFDGYRVQARIDRGKVRLLTRSGLDWTDRFGKPIANALADLDCEDAILDGEIVVPSDKGGSSFSTLQSDLSEGRHDRMVYFAFDLLFRDGVDLRVEPLIERKERLRTLIGEPEEGRLRYSEHFSEPGGIFLRHACRLGLEGVVSKRADAPYRSGRGTSWIKSKCVNRQEFIIVGYLPSEKTGRGLRSLLLAFRESGKLVYAGRVGTGFSVKVADDLKKRLTALKAGSHPFDEAPAGQKGAIWVRPELVAEIEFRAWTDERILRHASFVGLREDKEADEIVAEVPEDDAKAKTGKRDAGKAAKGGKSGQGKGAVKLSSPEKLLWPDAGITKKDLLDHYEAVWPRMEKYIVNRPLSLVRAPDGVDGQRFFQKHASPGMHQAIRRMKDPEDGEELLFIEDFDGLAALVQYGTVEIHIWGSTIDDIERPDQIVFDLDPDEGLSGEAVRDAAKAVMARLDELELPSLLKTSGGKGYHVMVPLKPKADWARVKEFAHDFAQAMAGSEPDAYTATLSKKARKGRIFIDYLRNGRGSTTVAPWSARGKPKATVSVPVPAPALEDGLEPDHFRIGSPELAKALKAKDPWAGWDRLAKPLGG